MAPLIKHRQTIDDSWTPLVLGAEDSPEQVSLPLGDVLFPLTVWQARKAEIISCHKRIGLLLQPDDAWESVVADLDYFVVIALNFPKFVDGRHYSTASLLRQRYHYAGEIRAIGDVLHDQLFYLQRVGVDAYVLKDGKNVVHALSHGFSAFSDSYQAASTELLPHFRRRFAA